MVGSTACISCGRRRKVRTLLYDMVFQGTVLGPQLWNLYFEDAADAIKEYMFEEIVYADDLNAYKKTKPAHQRMRMPCLLPIGSRRNFTAEVGPIK